MEGTAIKHFRKEFITKKGLPGCHYCKEQIGLGNYDAAFTQFSEVSSPKGRITVIEFELSNKCNLSCVMCNDVYSSLHDVKKRYHSPYDDDFVNQIQPYLKKVKRANFRGGEPFVIPLYYKLWDYLLANNKNVQIGITTNGTVWSDKIEQLLKSRQFNINVSIDTLNCNLYSKIRQNGIFELFSNNLNKFIEFRNKGFCNLSICTCIMTNNWMEMPEIFDLCEKNNLKIRINYVESPEYLSLKYAQKNEIKKILEKLYPYDDRFSYNSSVFKTMLSIIENYYQAVVNYKMEWYDIEPFDIVVSDFDGQKDFFYSQIIKSVNNGPNEKIRQLLVQCELYLTNKNELQYFYALLNKLAPSRIVEMIDKNYNEDELERGVKKLVEISKQKITLNEN